MKTFILLFLLSLSFTRSAGEDVLQADQSSTQQELNDAKIKEEVSTGLTRIFAMYGSIAAVGLAILAFFGIRSFGDFKEALKANLRSDLEKFVDEQIKERYTDEFLKTAKEIERLNLLSQLSESKLRMNSAVSEKDKSRMLENVKRMFESVKETGDTDLAVRYVEFMSRTHFQLREYEEISALIRKYGKDYTLSYGTWADNAIASMDLYELYGSMNYRKDALASSDQCLTLLPNYGTALAVKIMIYAIDYFKTHTDKAQLTKTINELLTTANSGSDTLVSFETWDYLRRNDKPDGAFKKYIDTLFTDFKDQMELMVMRYQEKMAKINSLSNPEMLSQFPATELTTN